MWVRLVEEGLNENRIFLPVACRYLGLSVAAIPKSVVLITGSTSSRI